VVPVIDVQILNDALLTLAFCVGLALLMAIVIVAAGALTQRHERREHVRSIERHLAAAAEDQDPASVR
jgi:cytochrome c biogenesis protein CcdA